MTRKAIDIRFVHAGDLTTKQAHELAWNEGLISHRYQEIAIVGDRVIGSWQYDIEWHRGACVIDSSHTGVSTRFQRRGIAQTLWLHGITRWRPVQIKATIGTDEGRTFLARMLARLAYVSPKTYLSVKPRTEDADTWESLCDYYAREFLRELGQQRIEAQKKQKALPKPKLEVAA